MRRATLDLRGNRSSVLTRRPRNVRLALLSLKLKLMRGCLVIYSMRHALAIDDVGEGPKQNRRIECSASATRVLRVEFDLLWYGKLVAPVDLRPARDARLDAVPNRIERDHGQQLSGRRRRRLPQAQQSPEFCQHRLCRCRCAACLHRRKKSTQGGRIRARPDGAASIIKAVLT